MKLSKAILYVGIIAYSIAILLFQDWPIMTASVGAFSAVFLGKMLVDIAFAAVALIRLAGPSLFADEDEADGVSLQAADLAVSDKALYGLFLLNVVGNLGFHGYDAVMTTGASSFGASVFFIVDVVVAFLTWMLFARAVRAANKAAKRGNVVGITDKAA